MTRKNYFSPKQENSSLLETLVYENNTCNTNNDMRDNLHIHHVFFVLLSWWFAGVR